MAVVNASMLARKSSSRMIKIATVSVAAVVFAVSAAVIVPRTLGFAPGSFDLLGGAAAVPRAEPVAAAMPAPVAADAVAVPSVAAATVAVPAVAVPAVAVSAVAVPAVEVTTAAPVVQELVSLSQERPAAEEPPANPAAGPVMTLAPDLDEGAQAALGPVLAQAAPPAAPPASGPASPASAVAVQGITDQEIRFGLAGPFSGPSKQLGLEMRLGIETAFRAVNDAGGVNGRKLALVVADDGYDPARTADAMKQLIEKERVFGFIGNVGTPTAAVALPIALSRQMLFYGAFTGANLLRGSPPDNYVFNFRASYAEETAAVVRYLVRTRRLKPDQIAVFAQQDGYGDAGYDGVSKAMRLLRVGGPGETRSAVLRLGYKRNTVDVDEAVQQLLQQQRSQKGANPIRAVVMVSTYRAAAKFIEKTIDQAPGLTYTNVSFVGSSSLAEELMVLGPRYAAGVIVTQVVPSIDSYAKVVLDYKGALTKYFPSEPADFVSFEAYVSANILVEALRRAGPALDTEKTVLALESLKDLELGLGTPVNFSRTDHQAIHRVWGTQLDATGKFRTLDLE